MSKKEKILWLFFVILFSLVIIIIITICLNKENNVNLKNKDDLKNKIIEHTWIYDESYYIDMNNTSSVTIFDSFQLTFSDTQVEICYDDECDNSNYQIDDNVLKIEKIKKFTGDYKISFEGEKLVLEYLYDNGNRMIYYFVHPVG